MLNGLHSEASSSKSANFGCRRSRGRTTDASWMLRSTANRSTALRSEPSAASVDLVCHSARMLIVGLLFRVIGPRRRRFHNRCREAYFRTGKEIFYIPEGKEAGIWAIRGSVIE